MSILNTAVNKQTVATKRNNTIGRALLIRRLNRMLAAMGRALNTGCMAKVK